MRILCVISGNYGRRIAFHLSQSALTDWQIIAWEGPQNLPFVIDEPEEFLPASLPEADLLLSLAENAGLSDLVADLADLCGAKAVIAPIDRWAWLPSGLSHQLARRLEERGLGYAFPAPFCTLRRRKDAHPLINEFADRFGAPELRCSVVDGKIAAWEILREAPCGNTRFIVNKLSGANPEEAKEMAGLFHHYYPCLADMDQAGRDAHTLLHQAAKISQAAVSRAVTDLQKISENVIETADKREENEHGSTCLSRIVER